MDLVLAFMTLTATQVTRMSPSFDATKAVMTIAMCQDESCAVVVAPRNGVRRLITMIGHADQVRASRIVLPAVCIRSEKPASSLRSDMLQNSRMVEINFKRRIHQAQGLQARSQPPWR